MMPQPVPKRPTNGATEPTVARKFSRSAISSVSWAIWLSMAVVIRPRSASGSRTAVLVDRRYSDSAAWATRATGRSFFPRSDAKLSKLSACQNSLSYSMVLVRSLATRRLKLTIIIHTHMLASSRPVMTSWTTMSASRKRRIGSSRVGAAAANSVSELIVPLARQIARKPRAIPQAGVWAGLRVKRSRRANVPRPEVRAVYPPT